MFITTVMPISTLLKIAFVFIIAIIIIRYVDKLRKTSFRGGKSINYLLKRNTKAFFKNRYNIKEEHKNTKDAKIHNINGHDDVIR